MDAEATNAVNFETAIVSTLQKICTIGNWEFGEAWLPDREKNHLNYFTAWFAIAKNLTQNKNLSLAEFKQASLNYTFNYAQGLPGKVWAKKNPVRRQGLTKPINLSYPKKVEQIYSHLFALAIF